MDAIDIENWPDCAIAGCGYKCCLALESKFCFHHTPGNKQIKLLEIGTRRARIDGAIDTVAEIIAETKTDKSFDERGNLIDPWNVWQRGCSLWFETNALYTHQALAASPANQPKEK